MTTSSFDDNHIPSLSGWRAVAISLVMLDHEKYAASFPYDHLSGWELSLFEQGNLGVRIFFVLSGLLITHLLLREAERAGSISRKHFFLRRCLRIMPVYFVYLGVLAGLIGLRLYGGETTSAWVGALSFTRNMVGPVASYTGHFWSLAVEEQFYLTWPLCLVGLSLWRRSRLAVALLLIPILVCPLVRLVGLTLESNGGFYGHVLGGNSLPVYADSLAIGCLGAFLLRRIPLRLTSVKASLVLLTALAVIALGVWSDYNAGKINERIVTACVPGIQAIGVLIAMWVTCQPECVVAYKILNWPPVNTLGVLSYSLYIWHVLFLSNYTGPSLCALLYDWRSWWLVSLAVAALSYYCVERPLLALKKQRSI